MINVSQAALDAIARGASPKDLESEGLEFKQEDPDARRTMEMVADAVVCLANSNGGTIVLGVANSSAGGSSPILGISARLTAVGIARGIFERTKPPLSVPVEEITHEDRRLVVVTVPRGVVFYANGSGTATRRIGSMCVPFSPEEQRQASAARGFFDWSAATTPGGVELLLSEEIHRLRRLLELAGREDLAREDDNRLLRDLRLLGEGDRATRAAVLLLGREKAITELVPTYGYAYQYRGSPGSEATARMRGRAPILAAVEGLLSAIDARSETHPINASGGVQLQMQDYPREAVREIVVNGLVHRDYELNGDLDIEHAPESLAITSPGGLVFGVTPENILTHPSTPRHRLLLETVASLQVAERTGQGIDRAYRELLRTGKAPPAITDSGFDVRVVLSGGAGNDSFARFAADLPLDLGRDVDVLLSLSSLRDRRGIDAVALAGLAQRAVPEAQLVLDRMQHAAVVEPTRRTARAALPTYALTAGALADLGRAVRYHVRKADDIDRKVADHMSEYGHVTNQTLRRLFDLDMFAARDLLRDLQQRDVIAKLDPGKGGPGIRYGPGQALAALVPNAPANRGRRRRRFEAAKEGIQLELGDD